MLFEALAKEGWLSWLKAPDSKSGLRVTVTGVRIPPLPPFFLSDLFTTTSICLLRSLFLEVRMKVRIQTSITPPQISFTTPFSVNPSNLRQPFYAWSYLWPATFRISTPPFLWGAISPKASTHNHRISASCALHSLLEITYSRAFSKSVRSSALHLPLTSSHAHAANSPCSTQRWIEMSGHQNSN